MGLASWDDASDGDILFAAWLNGLKSAILNQLNGNVDADNLKDLAVTAAKLASSSVTTDKINNLAVTFGKLATALALDEDDMASDSATAICTQQSIKAYADSIVQIQVDTDAAVATGTTIIPDDNTIPQITEGTEFLSVSITPKSATNRLVILSSLNVSGSVAAPIIAALFQDTTANAIGVSMHQSSSNDGHASRINMVKTMLAGTTSATTFKLRAGLDRTGTLTVNGVGGSGKFNGTFFSTLIVIELKV